MVHEQIVRFGPIRKRLSAMFAPIPVDAAPPPSPPSPPAYVVAATDERPRGPREIELCKKASTPDWLYFGSGLLLTAAAITLDNEEKYATTPQVRDLGPAAVGLTWGFTLGGGYLSIPKCSPDYVRSPPPEGEVRTDWQVAAVFAALAGLTAPIIMGTEIGGQPEGWSNGERVTRIFLSSGMGIVGALVPYLLPPKTWRAAKELERIRAGATEDGRGAFVSWGARF
jgi:hypothetical protein